MASPLQFAYRTQKAIGVYDADPVYESLPGFVAPEGNLRCCVYSPCGRYFAWASSDTVAVCDASVGHVLNSFAIANVFELGFSPRGTFLSTWERPSKDENGDATKNLKVWRTIEEGAAAAATAANGERQPQGRFVQKSQTGWNLQYTADEEFCARLVTNEVHFYNSGDLTTVHDKLRVEGVSTFALAPGKTHSVAVFIPERKGQPAAVRVYNVPHFGAPASQKTFFKGDKVQLKWNAMGSSLLVLAHTDVDKSNKSYYGETTLYILSATGGFDARITLDKEGPIHDVEWSPNSKEFGVVYGFMPAKTTIFNQKAEDKFTFPLGPRNTITFSPNGRFVLVAGFGNLAGQIDVYDLSKDYRKVCTIESGNPSVCQWSPDSRYIMTATTSPRLRVDNGIKLWHVGGGLIYNTDMVELYNVLWRPMEKTAPKSTVADPLTTVPTPHASAVAYLGARKTPSKPAGAYRPPGARGQSTPLHFKREDEGGAAHVVSNGISGLNGPSGFGSGANGFGRARRAVPGAELVELSGAAPVFVPGAEPADGGNEPLSKSALKNKKKRGNKKANRETEPINGVNGSNNGSGLAPPGQEYGARSGGEGRSPERRGQGQGQIRGNNGNNVNGTRNRSNTQRRNEPAGAGAAAGGGAVLSAPAPAAAAPAAPVAAAAAAEQPSSNQSPLSKKIRSLQKKIRAIEDLEMRHAGGEKLEDTQIKKIGTKSAVLRELEDLERQEKQ